MPPLVLPRVATPHRTAGAMDVSLATRANTASEPPGNKVDARKLLANSVQRETGSITGNALPETTSGPAEGTRREL